MNILLLIVESLRYDIFRIYNALIDYTDKGINFLNCFSCATSTPASITSILTGQLPSKHKRLFFLEKENYTTIASIAKANDYETYALSSNNIFEPTIDLAPDFDHKLNISDPYNIHNFDNFQCLADYIIQNGTFEFYNKRLYLIHTYSTHHPYGLNENIPRLKKSDSTLISEDKMYNAYCKNVKAVLLSIKTFLDFLFQVRSDFTIFFTADHGQILREENYDYLFNHTALFHEAVIHVPCFIYSRNIDPMKVIPTFQNNVLFYIMKQVINNQEIRLPKPPIYIEFSNKLKIIKDE